MCAGRISHQTPEGDLLLIKLPVRMIDRISDGIMLRRISLVHHRATFFSPACPASRLTEELKRPLPDPEVLTEQGHICSQNPDQRHIGIIMSFYDHLCAQEHVRLSSGKSSKNLLMRIFAPGSIHIH